MRNQSPSHEAAASLLADDDCQDPLVEVYTIAVEPEPSRKLANDGYQAVSSAHYALTMKRSAMASQGLHTVVVVGALNV